MNTWTRRALLIALAAITLTLVADPALAWDPPRHCYDTGAVRFCL